jgi:hypothetical protein
LQHLAGRLDNAKNKDSYSSLWTIFAVKLETFSSREDICLI